MAKLSFKVSEAPKRNLAEQSNFAGQLLPDGIYPATITASKVEPTKSGRGEALTLTCKFDSGLHIWPQINVKHESEKAAEIGQRELAELLQAVGIDELEDTVQLHGKALALVVRTEAARGAYKARNIVIGYRKSPAAAGGVPGHIPAAVTRQQPSAAAAGAGNPAPWARKQGGAQ